MSLRRLRAHLAQAIERTGRRLARMVGDDDEGLRLVMEQAARLPVTPTVPLTVPQAVELPTCAKTPCACTTALTVWEHMRRAGMEVNPPAWGPFAAAQFCKCQTGESQWH